MLRHGRRYLISHSGCATTFLGAVLFIAGCADSTIELRKELLESQDNLQTCQEQLVDLNNRLVENQQRIEALTNLGPERIEHLYLVQRVQIGRRSGGISTDDLPGDEAIRIYIEPIDQFGHVIKSPGRLTVRLFDLLAPDNTLIGATTYNAPQLGDLWVAGFTGQYYVLSCPWTRPPSGQEVTVQIQFTEYLTGKTFTDQRVVPIRHGVDPS